MSKEKVRLIAPKTKEEAVALLPRLNRFSTWSIRLFTGEVTSKGTQFDAESKASLEAMLISHGWKRLPPNDHGFEHWIICKEGDPLQYPRGPWPHTDWSFVKAIQFTIRVMAGRDAWHSDIVRQGA